MLLLANPIDWMLGGLTQWVSDGAGWLVRQLVDELLTALAPDLGVAWFAELYGRMLEVGAAVAPLFLLLAVIQALVTQNPGVLGRSLVNLLLAFALAGLVTGLTAKLIGLTDGLSIWLVGASGNVQTFGQLVAAGLVYSDQGAQFIAFVMAVATVLFGLLVFIELVIRDAAIYVGVLFFPLFLVASIWPKAMSMVRQLGELLVAIVLSKLVIVVVFVLGASAFLGLTKGGGLTGAIAGVAILMLAAFAPVQLLRLLPHVEAASAHVFNGASQRHAATAVHHGHDRVMGYLDEQRQASRVSQLTEAAVQAQPPPPPAGPPAPAAAEAGASVAGEAAAAAKLAAGAVVV